MTKVSKIGAAFAAFVAVMLVSSVAFAQGEGDASVVSQVLGHVIEIGAAVLGLLVMWMVRKITGYFEQKTKIDIPAATEAMIADWADRAVDYAEEKAHQLKNKKTKNLKGPEKLEMALGFGLALAEQHKFPELAKDKMTAYIESKLGARR